MENERDTLLSRSRSVLYTRYTLVASLTLVILEFLQTLDVEAELVWPAKWQHSKMLYFVSRYLPFAFVPLFIAYDNAPSNTTTTSCRALFSVSSVTLILGVLVADGVMYLRLYAVTRHTRRMNYILLVNFAIVTIVCLVGMGTFLYTQRFAAPPEGLDAACFTLTSKMAGISAAACYGALLYSSVFTMIVSLWYGVRLYLAMPGSTLVKIFYRDGAFYFVIIAAMSISNTLVSMFTPYRYLLTVPQAVSHTLLATRMILHLREAASSTTAHSLGSTQPRDPPRYNWSSTQPIAFAGPSSHAGTDTRETWAT